MSVGRRLNFTLASNIMNILDLIVHTFETKETIV